MIKAVIFDMFETLITHYESPLYFGEQIAEEIGLPLAEFLVMWRAYAEDRTLGRMTLEELIKQILDEKDLYSEALFTRVITKRKNAKLECFRHIHKDIIPMFETLKKDGIRIGLITNCFSEEAEVIRESELFPYFDAAMLSCEEGICKPDHRIFYECMDRLGVKPEDCLYVGDGGSRELETALELGMHPLQALWYLKEGTSQPIRKMDGFEQLGDPMAVLDYC